MLNTIIPLKFISIDDVGIKDLFFEIGFGYIYIWSIQIWLAQLHLTMDLNNIKNFCQSMVCREKKNKTDIDLIAFHFRNMNF